MACISKMEDAPADVLMETAAYLRRVRDLVAKPGAYRPHDRYGLGGIAFDERGLSVDPAAKEAVVFTPYGALARARDAAWIEVNTGQVDVLPVGSRIISGRGQLIHQIAWEAIARAGRWESRHVGTKMDGMGLHDFLRLVEKAAVLLDVRAERVDREVGMLSTGGGEHTEPAP